MTPRTPLRDDGDESVYFATLSQELMSESDERTLLDMICSRARDVVPDSDACGITVRRRRGRLETLAHDHEIALRCDELQYSLGEGPCLSAAVEDQPFLVTSTRDDPRWPRWGPAVAEAGVGSLISVELSSDTIDRDRDPLGAINLYSLGADPLGEDDLRRAKVFGVHAANALAAARHFTTLDEAVAARHQIGMAQGVLMQRYGLDSESSFETLQRYSSHSNVKLREVAMQVVTEGGLPDSYDIIRRDRV